MSQTSYTRNFAGPVGGSPAASGFRHLESMLNDSGAEMEFGIGVALKSAAKITRMAANGDKVEGIVLATEARDNDNLAATGVTAIKDKKMANVLQEGPVYVHAEHAVIPTDSVYCRHTSDGGANTVTGKFRKDSDSGRAVLVPGARWLIGGDSTTPPLLWFSRAAQAAVAGLKSQVAQISLTAAAEAGNAIVVTGQLQDLAGTPIAAVKECLVRTLAVTDNLGDITVTAGTGKKVVNPATGENVAWVETTGAGLFSVSIADSAVEDVMVQVTTEGGISAFLKITFA
jgi:hypothetical protein